MTQSVPTTRMSAMVALHDTHGGVTSDKVASVSVWECAEMC